MESLKAHGLTVDKGMLIGSPEAEISLAGDGLIGFRFSTEVQQIDLYLASKFFEANKSHPKLNRRQAFESPAGIYYVSGIYSQD